MKSYRWLWFFVLPFYVSGCTSYAPVHLPDDPGQTSESLMLQSSETLELGMRVRLNLKNGEKVEGTVIQITEESLAFGKPGNYGMKSEIFLFQDVESIEAAHSTEFANVTAILAVVVVVSFVALLVSIRASIGGEW